jgi:hypothetical protein
MGMDVLILEKSTRSGAAPFWFCIYTPKSRTAWLKDLTGRAKRRPWKDAAACSSPQKFIERTALDRPREIGAEMAGELDRKPLKTES